MAPVTPEDGNYIPAHDSALVMIDTALGFIERQVDEFVVSLFDGDADTGVYQGLASRSLAEKLDIVLDEENNPLEEEYGSKWCWDTVRKLVVLRQELNVGDPETTLSKWIVREDLIELSGSGEVREPLRSELALRKLLNGLCTYLDGWLAECGRVES